MGCSASLGNPGFFNRKQFDCNVFHETTTTLKFTENSDTTSPSENPKTSEENNNRAVVDSTVTLPNKLNNSNIVSDSKNDGLQVNQAHILIISRESSISSACSSNFNSTNIKRARSGSLAPGGGHGFQKDTVLPVRKMCKKIV